MEYKDAVKLVLSPKPAPLPQQPAYYAFSAYAKRLAKFAAKRGLKVGLVLYDPAAETVTNKVEALNREGVCFQAWFDKGRG